MTYTCIDSMKLSMAICNIHFKMLALFKRIPHFHAGSKLIGRK